MNRFVFRKALWVCTHICPQKIAPIATSCPSASLPWWILDDFFGLPQNAQEIIKFRIKDEQVVLNEEVLDNDCLFPREIIDDAIKERRVVFPEHPRSRAVETAMRFCDTEENMKHLVDSLVFPQPESSVQVLSPLSENLVDHAWIQDSRMDFYGKYMVQGFEKLRLKERGFDFDVLQSKERALISMKLAEAGYIEPSLPIRQQFIRKWLS